MFSKRDDRSHNYTHTFDEPSFFFFGAEAIAVAISPPFFSSFSAFRPDATEAGGGIEPRSEVGRVDDARTTGERNPTGDGTDMVEGEAGRMAEESLMARKGGGCFVEGPDVEEFPDVRRLIWGGGGLSSTKLSNSSSTSTSIPMSSILASSASRVSATSSVTARSTSMSSTSGSTLLMTGAGVATSSSSSCSSATAASGIVAGVGVCFFGAGLADVRRVGETACKEMVTGGEGDRVSEDGGLDAAGAGYSS